MTKTAAHPRDPRTDELLFRIGEAVGRLHNAEIVHGDLTTSNMMVKLRDDGAVPPVYDLVSPHTPSGASLWCLAHHSS